MGVFETLPLQDYQKGASCIQLFNLKREGLKPSPTEKTVHQF